MRNLLCSRFLPRNYEQMFVLCPPIQWSSYDCSPAANYRRRTMFRCLTTGLNFKIPKHLMILEMHSLDDLISKATQVEVMLQFEENQVIHASTTLHQAAPSPSTLGGRATPPRRLPCHLRQSAFSGSYCGLLLLPRRSLGCRRRHMPRERVSRLLLLQASRAINAARWAINNMSALNDSI